MKNLSGLAVVLSSCFILSSATKNQIKESLDGVEYYVDIPMTPVDYTMNGEVYSIHVNQGVVENRATLASRDDPSLIGCPVIEENDSPRDYCGDNLYWNDTTQDTSPLRSDCEIIVDFLKNKGTHYGWGCIFNYFRDIVHLKVTVPIIEYNSCCFGVDMGDLVIGLGMIGDQDVSDLISGAMNKYPGGDKIGANGNSMPCANILLDANVGTTNTSWAIFNPNYTMPWEVL